MNNFIEQRTRILNGLKAQRPDASLKGAPDAEILDLLNCINHKDFSKLYVTTSSCSGRLSIFANSIKVGNEEIDASVKSPNEDDEYPDSTSSSKRYGKGSGGWLGIYHTPIADEIIETASNEEILRCLFGPSTLVSEPKPEFWELGKQIEHQYINLKFEPMILHVLASDIRSAQQLLGIAINCGFRESGVIPTAKRVMVGIRSSLRLETPIAIVKSGLPLTIELLVSVAYIRQLLRLANCKFKENTRRLNQLKNSINDLRIKVGSREPPQDRAARKRAEGLERRSKMYSQIADA